MSVYTLYIISHIWFNDISWYISSFFYIIYIATILIFLNEKKAKFFASHVYILLVKMFVFTEITTSLEGKMYSKNFFSLSNVLSLQCLLLNLEWRVNLLCYCNVPHPLFLILCLFRALLQKFNSLRLCVWDTIHTQCILPFNMQSNF